MAEDVSPENHSDAGPELVEPVSSDTGSATQSADINVMAVNHESRPEREAHHDEHGISDIASATLPAFQTSMVGSVSVLDI